MRRRYKIALGLALLGIITAAMSLLLQPEELGPVLEGKPLTFWLRDYRRSNPQTQLKAQAVVRAAGTNAFPALLRLLRERDSAPKNAIVELLKKQRFFRTKIARAADRNAEGSLGFTILGPLASNAVPGLIRVYEQEVSSSSRFWSATALGAIGPSASNAVPSLVRGLATTNINERLGIVAALGEIHSRPELAVPALATALRDPQTMVRYYAARALEKFGREATSAVPVLTETLQDPDGNVRQAAAGLLQRINQPNAQ